MEEGDSPSRAAPASPPADLTDLLHPCPGSLLDPAASPSEAAPSQPHSQGTAKRKRGGGAQPAATGSAYRGVSTRREGRWRAAIKHKGVTHDLGTYCTEEAAAQAYDRACICCRGPDAAELNFPADQYAVEAERLQATSLADFAAGASRASDDRRTSSLHGVRRNKRARRWEATIRVAGSQVYLGLYDTEEAAAQAYDQAAILRYAQGVGAMGTRPARLATNYPADLYTQLAGAGDASQDAAAVPVQELARQHIESVMRRCRGFVAAAAAAAAEPPPAAPDDGEVAAD